MKILFISEYYPPKIMGGGEINLAQIAQELARKKHEVVVLTSSFPGLPVEELGQGIQIYRRLQTGKNASTLFSNFRRRFLFPRSVIREARKLIGREKPDLVHFIGTSIIAAPALRKDHQRLFATIESYPTLCPKGDRLYHGKEECRIKCDFRSFVSCQKDSAEIGKMKNRWYLKYNPLFLLLNYRYYQRLNKSLASCHLIAISGYVQKLLYQHQQPSIVIPNAFDAAPFFTTVQVPPNPKPVLLYVGSLIRSKGPQIMLEALKWLNCRAEFYGDGILKEQLRQTIMDHNLDADIFSPVPYERMPEVYARAEVVVFPSLWPEPFGRIPLEALAAGKPIIASNIGAIPEIVGSQGRLVHPGEAQALRLAITTVLSTIPRPKASLSKYKPATVISRLLHAYEERT